MNEEIGGMTLWHWIELGYLVFALICPIVFAFKEAWVDQRRSYRKLPIKSYLTYGQIIRGFGFGVIPVLNIIITGYCIAYILDRILDQLDDKPVFKVLKKDE